MKRTATYRELRRIEYGPRYGVRRQSEATTALWHLPTPLLANPKRGRASLVPALQGAQPPLWPCAMQRRLGYTTHRRGFTLIELLVVVAVLTVLSALLASGLAQTHPGSRAVLCLSHLQQLTLGWHQYADDHNGLLLTCQDGILGNNGLPRPNWVSGGLDFNGNNRSNWDTNQDLAKGPLWSYVGGNASVFKCPADPAVVTFNGMVLPRVRSMSLSQVFSRGEWLDESINSNQKVWRTYEKVGTIVKPANTFAFIDEHPDSINDAAFACACTGNQPGDSPQASQIIDYPAAYHDGGCGISFADGHAEIHKWVGLKVARAPITLTGSLALNVPSGDSWIDMHWLAANTTVPY